MTINCPACGQLCQVTASPIAQLKTGDDNPGEKRFFVCACCAAVIDFTDEVKIADIKNEQRLWMLQEDEKWKII